MALTDQVVSEEMFEIVDDDLNDHDDFSVLEKRALKMVVAYMYIAWGAGPDNPLKKIIFH